MLSEHVSEVHFRLMIIVTIGDSFAKCSVPTFCAQLPNKPVARHLQRLQEAFVEWDRDPAMCSLLVLLLNATTLKDGSSWAVGHLVLIRKDCEPYLFYIGSPHPKLLLLIDCSQISHVSIVVLGASAYPDPLSFGCVPIAMQSFREVEALSFSEQLIVEHDRGSWYLHCGTYVTQQGGCIPCFLHKVGVFDFCPWHSEENPDNRCSGHQVLHLVGKKQAGNEVNVMGYIDEFPLQCQLLLFHVFSEEDQPIFQHRICPLEVPFLLPAHGSGISNLSDSDCSVLLSPFQRRNLPNCLSQHFLIRAAGKNSFRYVAAATQPDLMTNTVGRLPNLVSSSMKRFFCILVKQSFWHRFGFQCPQSLHRIKNLSFLSHLIKTTVPWRNIRISDLQEYLQLSPEQWDDCLASHEFRLQEYPQLMQVGDDLLNYRIEVRQAIPTRLKAAFSWNMNSWQLPKSCREDQKMRRVKKLLKVGPVLLQETKWHRNQEEILLQHISGLQIVSTNAKRTDNDAWSGGAAILLPAGWVISQRIVLLAGRAVAVLVNDRCAPFYLLSVYLHPDHVQSELEHIISSWRNVEKRSDKVVIGGDFNQADVKCPEIWKKFLALFTAVDLPVFWWLFGPRQVFGP